MMSFPLRVCAAGSVWVGLCRCSSFKTVLYEQLVTAIVLKEENKRVPVGLINPKLTIPTNCQGAFCIFIPAPAKTDKACVCVSPRIPGL